MVVEMITIRILRILSRTFILGFKPKQVISIFSMMSLVFCCRFLESLMSSEIKYTVAITAFWAIEAVYQQSFAHFQEDGTNTL